MEFEWFTHRFYPHHHKFITWLANMDHDGESLVLIPDPLWLFWCSFDHEWCFHQFCNFPPINEHTSHIFSNHHSTSPEWPIWISQIFKIISMIENIDSLNIKWDQNSSSFVPFRIGIQALFVLSVIGVDCAAYIHVLDFFLGYLSKFNFSNNVEFTKYF